jgi:hypothetical protein
MKKTTLLTISTTLSNTKFRAVDWDDLGDHPVYCVMTGGQILDQYYIHWSERMIEVGKLPMITELNCVEDWIVVNWAVQVE